MRHDKPSQSAFIRGALSIVEGMASICSSFSPRRSPQMEKILKDLDLPDRTQMMRDARNIRGWRDLDPWEGPPNSQRVWPLYEARRPRKKS